MAQKKGGSSEYGCGTALIGMIMAVVFFALVSTVVTIVQNELLTSPIFIGISVAIIIIVMIILILRFWANHYAKNYISEITSLAKIMLETNTLDKYFTAKIKVIPILSEYKKRYPFASKKYKKMLKPKVFLDQLITSDDSMIHKVMCREFGATRIAIKAIGPSAIRTFESDVSNHEDFLSEKNRDIYQSMLVELSNYAEVVGTIFEADSLEGHDFEYWCAELLEKNGYTNVIVTQGSGDQGVDITATMNGIRYAIQCKCYSSDLGNTPIQEVTAGKAMYNCQIGAVMTNRYFTKGAKELARATGTLLWDRDKLIEMLQIAQN